MGKILFLFFTFYLLTPFFMALKMKIEKPNFKNLNNTEFIIIGLILFILIIINIQLFKPFFKKIFKL